MISKLFEKLLADKSFFLKANKGTEFEERISKALIGLGYTSTLKDDFSTSRFKNIKSWVSRKDDDSFLDVEAREKK